MAQAITVDTKTVNAILSLLKELRDEVIHLSEKLEGAPPYGSKEWWEWSDRKAMKDVKAGRYTEIRTKKELQEFFDSLKRS